MPCLWRIFQRSIIICLFLFAASILPRLVFGCLYIDDFFVLPAIASCMFFWLIFSCQNCLKRYKTGLYSVTNKTMEDLGVGAQSAKELLDAMSIFQQMVDDFDRKIQQMKTERAAAAEQLQKYTEAFSKTLSRGRSRSPDPRGRPSPQPEKDSQRAPTIAYDNTALTPSPGDDPGDEHRSAACAPRARGFCERVDLTLSDEKSSSAKAQSKEPAADKGKEPAADKGKKPAQGRCPWYTNRSVYPCPFELGCPECCPCPESAEVQRLAKERCKDAKNFTGKKDAKNFTGKKDAKVETELSPARLARIQQAAHSAFLKLPAWEGKDGWHSEIKKNEVIYSWLDGLQQKTYPLVENTSCADFLSIATKLETADCASFLRKLHAALEQHAASAGASATESENMDEADEDEAEYVSDEVNLTKAQQKEPCWCEALKCWQTYVADRATDWKEVDCYPFLDLQELTPRAMAKLKTCTMGKFVTIADNVDNWCKELVKDMQAFSARLEEEIDATPERSVPY